MQSLGKHWSTKPISSGSVDGKLTFHVVAHPKTSFLTARCGFAVLHPLDGVTGRPATIEHVDGAIEQGIFPELIAPWQPFTEIRSITHEVAPGVVACCRMEGDIFEMEDQRNWSDASYKTYVRPITLPWPYTMEPGIPNQQSIELHIEDSNPTLPVLVTGNATRDRDRWRGRQLSGNRTCHLPGPDRGNPRSSASCSKHSGHNCFCSTSILPPDMASANSPALPESRSQVSFQLRHRVFA